MTERHLRGFSLIHLNDDDGGEGVDDHEMDMIPKELQFEEEKLQLKHFCRMAIREHLLKLDLHHHLFGRIPRLGLPSSLTSYLLFCMSLHDDDDDVDAAAAADDDGEKDDDGGIGGGFDDGDDGGNKNNDYR